MDTILATLAATRLACARSDVLFSDAYTALLGDYPTQAMGAPFKNVRAGAGCSLTGTPARFVEVPMSSDAGPADDRHWTCRYATALEEVDDVCGMICATTETMDQVVTVIH